MEISARIIAFISLMSIGYYRRGNRKYPRDNEKRREKKQISTRWESPLMKAVRVLMSLFYILAFVFVLYPEPFDIFKIEIPDYLRVVGILGTILGTVVIIWATRTLGDNFSPVLEIREGHQLVTKGPYRWVRHPMYVGNVIWILSFILLSAWWIFALYLIIFVVFIMIIRTSKEEQMLLETFGKVYEDYMKTTGCFFPKLKK